MSLNTDKFRDIFISEAEERLSGITTILLEIEKGGAQETQFAELMRSAHTIKGSAATMGYTEVASLAHALEDVFHLAERGALQMDSRLITAIFSSVDTLTESLQSLKRGNEEISTNAQVEMLQQLLHPSVSSVDTENIPAPQERAVFVHAPNVVKVNTERLDTLMGIFEELLMLRLKLGTTLEPGMEMVRNSGDSTLKQKLFFVHEISILLERMSKLLAENQDALLSTRLVPLGQIFGQYPRMVRDLAVREGKKIEFIIRGEDVALDRTVIDGLGGALAHLLRNAVDHGIADEGIIVLAATRERGRAKVIVEDNGKGIDYERVKQVAIDRGVATKEHIESLSQSALAEILFHPNMSTNKEVTDVSGRGVGVSAVHVFAKDIGGHLEVLSPIPQIGRGTRFTLDLPISLTTVRVLMVASSGYVFAVPFDVIIRTHVFYENEVTSIAHQEALMIDGTACPLLRLKKILGLTFSALPDSSVSPDKQSAIFIQGRQTPIMLHVDEIIGEQELLVKSLPPVLHGIKGFSGSALLPDGRTILLIDIHGLLAKAEEDILEHIEK